MEEETHDSDNEFLLLALLVRGAYSRIRQFLHRV